MCVYVCVCVRVGAGTPACIPVAAELRLVVDWHAVVSWEGEGSLARVEYIVVFFTRISGPVSFFFPF